MAGAGRGAIARAVLGVLLALSCAQPVRAAGTLGRIHDPVVLPFAKLAGVPVTETARLRLFRIDDSGGFLPIPYQFDARTTDGELVVDGPSEFGLDQDDELVFMAKDAGPRVAPGAHPDGCDALLEIEIAEPDGDGRAWAYLASFTAPPTVSFEPYVTFDMATRQARSALYRVDYAEQRNFFTGVHVLEGGGGDRSNLLRQSRMRGSPTFSLLLADVTLDFTEQNSMVEIEGVRSGPVRAVRRVKLSVDLGPLFPELPSGTAYTYHYLSSYTTPTRVKFPWLMLQTLRDFRFENVLDFRPDAAPLRYHDAWYPDGIALSADAPLEVRTTEDRDWWVHSSSAGTMLHAFVIPQVWRDWGVVRGTVVRSVAGLGEMEGAPGGGPAFAAGYTLLNMANLREAGGYDLLMASVVLPGAYAAGDEVGPMAMLRAPLTTSVRRLF
jgi:hypothetical protein